MLETYFKAQQYRVLVANDGKDGIELCQNHRPNLVILDIRLPDIDGFEVARRLRANRRTRDVPIIFLTEKRERKDRLQGLQLQADDYINKPFDTHELRLRVRNALLRSLQSNLTNPVTGLPQGRLIDEALSSLLGSLDQHLLLFILRNLDRFREMYGIVAQDDLLRSTAMMIKDVLTEQGLSDAFFGQIIPAGFVIISDHPEKFSLLRQVIIRRLEPSFNYFYSERDRTQGIDPAQRLVISTAEINPADIKHLDIQQVRAGLERACHQVNS
jgi:CheY-like chemotaxis protein